MRSNPFRDFSDVVKECFIVHKKEPSATNRLHDAMNHSESGVNGTTHAFCRGPNEASRRRVRNHEPSPVFAVSDNKVGFEKAHGFVFWYSERGLARIAFVFHLLPIMKTPGLYTLY